MGGTIKQNRAINWGHLESCHLPFSARRFASIQKYVAQGVKHCQCVIPTEDAEVLCTGVCPLIWERVTPVVCCVREGMLNKRLFVWIKWWKVLSWRC